MKSTTWPLGKPGDLNKRSIRFPTTPPRANPPRISQPLVLNFGPNHNSAKVARLEMIVNTQVLAGPIEKAAFELKARVKCRSSPSIETGAYGSR